MKRKVTLVFGGKSPEHEISIRSATSLFAAFDRSENEVRCVYVNRDGAFYAMPVESFPPELKKQYTPEELNAEILHVIPGKEQPFQTETGVLETDFIFSILHGQNGEDGSFQGMLQLLNLPFAGCDIFSSALCMDKTAVKPVLESAGIRNAKYIILEAGHPDLSTNTEKIKNGDLGFPVFVKPSRLGSSVGVSKVKNPGELNSALSTAFGYDSLVLVEEMIQGREVECAVLGNERPRASEIGEIVPDDSVYSFDSKYEDPDAAKLLMPAPLDPQTSARLKEFAVKCYRALYCEGFARVDMFLTQSGNIYLNEINTLPGFTDISMYPALWKVSGIETPDLLNEIISLGMQRQQRKSSLKTSRL